MRSLLLSTQLSRYAILSIVVCLFASSALADSFTFTGNASLGNDLINFFLSGPSFDVHSASSGGPTTPFTTCIQGSLCQISAQFVQTTLSNFAQPGDFSGGTVGGVTASTLTGRLSFSSFSFITGTDPNTFGSGPVTFTGDLTGFVFLPLGCETSGSCTDVGPQVFHLHLSGTGTATASGQGIGEGEVGIFGLRYVFSGSATTVPEPSSLLLVSSGIAGLAGIRHLRGKLANRLS